MSFSCAVARQPRPHKKYLLMDYRCTVVGNGLKNANFKECTVGNPSTSNISI
jgi:hypothetical protein